MKGLDLSKIYHTEKEENGILIRISTYTQTRLKARIMISILTMKALAGVLD